MSRFYKGLVLALALATPALAVFEPTPKAARPQGMGGAFTGVADDVTAIHYNPAGLTRVDALQAHLFGTRLFGLKELQDALLDVAYPISKQAGTVGVSVEQFGDDTLLRERTITASHGIPLQEDLRGGYNLNLYDLKIGPEDGSANDFGSDRSFGLDVGVMAHIKKVKKDLWVGGFMRNVNQPKVGKSYPKELSRANSVGMSFSPYSGAWIMLDVTKEVTQPRTMWRGGMEFELAKWTGGRILLRAGAHSSPQRWSAGATVKVGPLAVDYAFYNHELLSDTHLVSLRLNFGRAKKKAGVAPAATAPTAAVPKMEEKKEKKAE